MHRLQQLQDRRENAGTVVPTLHGQVERGAEFVRQRSRVVVVGRLEETGFPGTGLRCWGGRVGVCFGGRRLRFRDLGQQRASLGSRGTYRVGHSVFENREQRTENEELRTENWRSIVRVTLPVQVFSSFAGKTGGFRGHLCGPSRRRLLLLLCHPHRQWAGCHVGGGIRPRR
jgi:hypothetical protein